jgi:hypothetical protein
LNLDRSFSLFQNPPREFGPIPFWFWNDDLDEDELIGQLHAFHQAGFGGVLPHARIGLSHRVGYLTDEYFRLMRRVVEEAKRLEMKVILYDEASYPSGSARGEVVATNPDFASQAIGLWEKEIKGPFSGFWRPNTGRALLDRHVCTLLGKLDGQGRIDPDSVQLLKPHPNTIFHLAVPAGRWQAMSVWNTHSGGHIRGAFPEEESGHATAPPAGDILNPEAVACFLHLTHDRYYEQLGEFFGDPIIALFTDEPGVFGKSPQRPKAAKPFTPGFVEWLQSLWGTDPRPWLPALWLDYGPETAGFRRRYAEAVQTRLHQVFYAAQSRWCADHGIALTGHPAGSDELSALRYFQLPGQDMVWRYVEPGKPSAIEGAHSIAPKAATSAARVNRSRRVLTEVCGAYGWGLTLDEIKWLFDWHLVRGNNLINPHAVFYSIRDRRAWESEPDLGVHNIFWPYFGQLAVYARRLSWLLADGEQVCDLAVLGDGNALPWQAAKQLYQNQIDFLYIDDSAVSGGNVESGSLGIGTQQYRAVVIDGDPLLSEETRKKLEAFAASGGLLLTFAEGMDLPAHLDSHFSRDIRLNPAHPDLRFIHYRKDELDFYLLVNEGEEMVSGELSLDVTGTLQAWDPLAGGIVPLHSRETETGLRTAISLERRDSLVLAIDRDKPFNPSTPPPAWAETETPLSVSWEVFDDAGKRVDIPALGDWSQQPDWELFSGTLCFRSELEFPRADELLLDLGTVGDIAETLIDGHPVGLRLWSPYRIPLPPQGPGIHQLEIRVTNSMANAFEGIQAPSGLIGPVTLIARNST